MELASSKIDTKILKRGFINLRLPPNVQTFRQIKKCEMSGSWEVRHKLQELRNTVRGIGLDLFGFRYGKGLF